MVELILFLLGSIGLSVIVTMSNFLRPFRELFNLSSDKVADMRLNNYEPTKKERIRLKFYELFSCPLCFGLWAGAIMWGVMMIPVAGFWIAGAFSSATVSYLYAEFVDG